MHSLSSMSKVRSVKGMLIVFILFASITLQNNRAMEENSQTISFRDQMNNGKIHRFEKDTNDQVDLQNHPELSKSPDSLENYDRPENHITNWKPRGINPDVVDPATFVSYWNTSLTSSGSSSDTQVQLPLTSSGTYNFSVYWGDGSNNTITTWNDPAVTHTYSTSGVYNITIAGTLIGWSFQNTGDRLKLMEIAQWGDLRLGNSGFYFYGSSNLRLTANDTLDLTGTTSLSSAFKDCWSLGSTGDMNSWDVSQVKYMESMFNQVNLSISNYDNILTGWSALNLQHGVPFDAGHSKYSSTVGEPASTYIIDTFGWSIRDGGVYTLPTTNTTSTTSTTSSSTTNPTPLSWVALIVLPILAIMMQYKRKFRKNY